MRDQPLEGDVDVVLLLAGDGVAADLPILDGVQVHLLEDLACCPAPGLGFRPAEAFPGDCEARF